MHELMALLMATPGDDDDPQLKSSLYFF